MKSLRWLTVLAGIVIVWAGGVRGRSQDQAVPTPPVVAQPAPAVHQPAEFAGLWDYNAEESVNAATGRPEQGIARRRAGAPAIGGTTDPSGRSRGGGSGGGGTGVGDGSMPGGGVPGGTGLPPSVPPGGSTAGALVPAGAAIVNNAGSDRPRNIGAAPPNYYRDLRRDLMEVPERLTIRVEKDAITFIDDLERSLTYITTGRKVKQQLGAATFDARAAWSHSQLQIAMTGPQFFKMQQTYFLNSDGTRLFVVMRIGEIVKGAPPDGVNRVYNHVDSSADRR